MRVNVYEEEVGEAYEIIEQVSRKGEQFRGLRIWLKSCQSLIDHSTAEDDDRSAITFWFRYDEEMLDFLDCLYTTFETSGKEVGS